MKTEKEYFLGLVSGETAAFVRVFEALPADKLDWKPDPKASSAAERAGQIAGEGASLPAILEKGVFDFDPDMKMPVMTPAQMADTFKKGMEQAKTIAQGMTDADWDSPAAMTMKGKEVWKSTKGEMALGFMLDLIHHRGQLSVYIRPMGGKVPSIYGPSADSE